MKAKYTILVVDDEAAHSLLISELLRKAGHIVTTANDGFKALAACKVRTPDVIILDLHMPLMSGMEVSNRLKNNERTNGIPIIFLANKSEAIPEFKSEEQINEDILFKPFEPNELLARLKAVLKEKALREELHKKEDQLKELTLVDPVTSLKTPRYLSEFLKTSIKQAKRYHVPLSVVVVEVDQHRELMKAVGQKAADSMVTQLASVISKQMRDSDITVRTGPFEFTVVLTVTDKNGAIEVAERLRNTIADSTFTAGEITLQISMSIGICQYMQQMDDEGKILMSHARAAVAEGHTNGGNVTLMAE